MTAKKLTKKGAMSVTAALDRLASLFQSEFKTLKVPAHIASDFAYRCDLLSDHIEEMSGVKTALDGAPKAKVNYPVTGDTFDAEVIGEEQGGPAEGDSDEPYMKGEFTQQENRELRERQEAGDLGMSANPEPQAPQAGKQATYETIGRREAANRIGILGGQIQKMAVKTARNTGLSKRLARLASILMRVQVGVLSGKVAASNVQQILKALNHLVPHAMNVSNATAPKVAHMVDLTIQITKKAEDEEDEPEEPEEGKEAAEEEPEKTEEEPEEEKKEASHGFKLDA